MGGVTRGTGLSVLCSGQSGLHNRMEASNPTPNALGSHSRANTVKKPYGHVCLQKSLHMLLSGHVTLAVDKVPCVHKRRTRRIKILYCSALSSQPWL